jgi:hypothetical protein
MSTGFTETADLPAVEWRFSDTIPFGSYDYISQNLSAVYAELLAAIAEQSSAAAELLRLLQQVDDGRRAAVLRDCALRRTIEDGACRIVNGVNSIEAATLEELLSAAAGNAAAEQRSVVQDAASGVPFGGRTPGHASIWVDDQPRTPSGRHLAHEVLKRVPGFQIKVPTEERVQTLVAAERIASQVAPRLARSAISHVSMVMLGEFEDEDHPFHALTMPGLPGVVLLSPKALASSVDAAETLIHESMHLKFLDMDYVHPLFAHGFTQASSPRVTPIWHRDKPGTYGQWPIDRVLTSMHVYSALAVFFGLASNRGDRDFYDHDECASRAAGCRTRATWLFEAAQEYLALLTASGREFVAFIGASLAELSATAAT